ncbi:MAG: efflux RND transporter periplasmic adaptor subunit [Pirellulales bacterium]
MNGGRSWCAHLALAALVSCASSGCQPEVPEARDVVRPVKTTVVTAGDHLRVRVFPGRVDASRQVELAFRVPGLLASLPVKEGQTVKAGEVIAQLRQDEFDARLKTLQGELDQARAGLRAVLAGERPEEVQRREAELRSARSQLANARTNFERNARLVAQNAVSRAVYEQSETAYKVAQEQYTAAQAMLEQSSVGREEDVEAMEARVRSLEGRVVEARVQLDDSTLRAPYDGVIAQRFVNEGQNIVPNDRVVQFQDLQEIEIATDIPESVMVGEIDTADIVQITAELSAAPGVEFPVRIREVGKVADPVTQTFNVRVAMPAPTDLRVLPGMTASVRLEYRRSAALGQRILVPVESIAQVAGGQPTAWLLGENDSLVPRRVQVGPTTGEWIEVTEGLEPGDRIVVAGVRFLREGMKVRDLGDELGGTR